MIIRIIVDFFLCFALVFLFLGAYRMIISKNVYDKIQSFDIISRGSGIAALLGFCIWSFANNRRVMALLIILMIIIILIIEPLLTREICKNLLLKNVSSAKGGE